jgi:hypothetical protein
MLVGADLVQAAADEGPAGTADGERDFADGDDVPNGQRPQLAPVIAAGQVLAAGVAGVAVADGERLFGDLLRGAPGGAGLVGEDTDHGMAGLVAVQHGDVPPLPVEGDIVPDGECDTRSHMLRANLADWRASMT